MEHVERTRPYPWPWDGGLHRRPVALVLTGWDSYWRSRCHEADAVLRRARALASAADVCFTVSHQWSDLMGSEALRDALPTERHVHVRAFGISAFHGSALESEIRRRGLELLVLGGFALETTVHATLRHANDSGLECLLAADASGSLEPQIRGNAISMIELSGGTFGAVGSSDAIESALLRRAGVGRGSPA